MADIPPLPEPGFQSPDDRRTIGRRFILQARDYLEKGDRLQAGEKAWGAIAHNLKSIGESRGWRHDSHRLVENIGRQIVAESLDTDLGVFISEVYHKGHENFYENQRSEETLKEVIEEAEQAVPLLETFQGETPHPFTIASNTQLRRLRELTGNNGLQVGDTSPVGFSLKHPPGGNDKASEQQMDVGYIGTGTMGNPMARCLLDAGHNVTVYDVRREATTNLCELGAHWADSPRAVAEGAGVVFTSLPGPVEAERVVLDPDTGILAGLPLGGAWIDTTTNAPSLIRRLAEVCSRRGVEMLDSPVSGRPPAMTMMVGGDPAVFEKHRPVLECMGRDVFYVGETASGCIAKLVTQYLGYCAFIAGLEGMLIGAKAGIDLEILAKIIPVSAGSSSVLNRATEAILDRSFASNGTLDIVAKDIHLACELARESQAPASIGAIADDMFQRAQVQGMGQDGFPSVARILEQLASAELLGKG